MAVSKHAYSKGSGDHISAAVEIKWVKTVRLIDKLRSC